jgi:methionyl-tRNA formyltransferase
VQISVASSSLISIPIIKAISQSSHNLASIITLPDRKVGRGQDFAEQEIASWGRDHGLLVAKPEDVSQINQHLLEVQPQLVVTASYGKLIPPELLHGPRFGWLNLHFSLLPRWRGAAPVQWAILEGDERTGISIFKLDKGMDTGPIYLQEEVELLDDMTTQGILIDLAQLGADRILEVVEMIAQGVRPRPQGQSQITLAPKISKEMGALDWKKSGIEISRKVRALGERPGTYTHFRGIKINIHSVRILQRGERARNTGELWLEAGAVYTQCGDCTVEILEVTPAGKKRMTAVEFIRGIRLIDGEGFTSVG